MICATFLRAESGSKQPAPLAKAHSVASIRHAQSDVEPMESAVDRLGLRLQGRGDAFGAVAHLLVAQKLKVAICQVRAISAAFSSGLGLSRIR